VYLSVRLSSALAAVVYCAVSLADDAAEETLGGAATDVSMVRVASGGITGALSR